MGVPDSQSRPGLSAASSGAAARQVCGYYCRTDGVRPADVEIAGAWLSADERARSRRFGFAEDARDFTCAHLLVRVVLARSLACDPKDVPLRPGRLGRPVIDGVPLAVSLSHARGLVACAVAPSCWLGLDVEAIDPAVDLPGIAREYFTPAEVAALDGGAAATRAARFYETWTLKESLLKATGLTPWELRSASFERIDGRPVLTGSASVSVAAWQCLCMDVGDAYKLAIVAGSPDGACGDVSVEAVAATALVRDGALTPPV